MGKGKWLTAVAACTGMLVLILDSRTAFVAAAQGVELCIRTVIPSLFPFLYLSGVFSAQFSNSPISWLAVLGSVFKLPKGMDYLLIPAFLGGYPIGAKCVSQAYAERQIGRAQAERLLAYCSNPGPAFVFGILSSKFGGGRLTWAIWGIQVLSAWTAARFFDASARSRESSLVQEHTAASGIEVAIQAMLKICGWVILFKILIGFLDRWVLWAVGSTVRVMVMGLLELTNGCCSLNLIADEGLRFILCNVLLAFGGLCVAYQTASVCQGLSLRYYFVGKALQGAAAGLFAGAFYYLGWAVIPIWVVVAILLSKCMKNNSRNPQLLGV